MRKSIRNMGFLNGFTDTGLAVIGLIFALVIVVIAIIVLLVVFLL